MPMREEEWLGILSRYVKPARVTHSLGVAQTARSMAERFGADPEKAYWAGLVHDVGKGFSPPLLLEYASRLHLDKDPVYRRVPSLLHGPAGSLWLREEGFFSDPELLHAVYAHTIPDLPMSRLDRILFTADMIEPNRKAYPGLTELRDLSGKDLDKLYFRALQQTLSYAISRGQVVHPGTLIAFNDELIRTKTGMEVD